MFYESISNQQKSNINTHWASLVTMSFYSFVGQFLIFYIYSQYPSKFLMFHTPACFSQQNNHILAGYHIPQLDFLDKNPVIVKVCTISLENLANTELSPIILLFLLFELSGLHRTHLYISIIIYPIPLLLIMYIALNCLSWLAYLETDCVLVW